MSRGRTVFPCDSVGAGAVPVLDSSQHAPRKAGKFLSSLLSPRSEVKHALREQDDAEHKRADDTVSVSKTADIHRASSRCAHSGDKHAQHDESERYFGGQQQAELGLKKIRTRGEMNPEHGGSGEIEERDDDGHENANPTRDGFGDLCADSGR